MKYAHVSMPRDLPGTPASAVDHEHQDVHNKTRQICRVFKAIISDFFLILAARAIELFFFVFSFAPSIWPWWCYNNWSTYCSYKARGFAPNIVYRRS